MYTGSVLGREKKLNKITKEEKTWPLGTSSHSNKATTRNYIVVFYIFKIKEYRLGTYFHGCFTRDNTFVDHNNITY
jgi:hypothetical protein